MQAVTLQNVSKSFGAVDVIKDVSVDIAPGEFCVLIGPSGSGKSTLLRIIAGLEDVSAGSVHIGGRDVTALPAKARDIAMVFQSYALYPQMTVRENMSFALRLAGRPKAEIARKTDEVARMLELGKLMDRLPKELSGGQRQRVAMGRAIVRDPSVFLFDEPLSNLDAKLRGQVRGEIRDLHQRLQTTSVYVTHDQVEAMTMGHKVVVLRDGRVEQAGAPLDLYDRPTNVFVAGFIGSPPINLYSGRAEAGRIRLPGDVALELPEGHGVADGRDVVLGLRPEYLQPADPGAADAIPARVHAVESTGSETTVVCDSAAGRITLCSKQRSTLAPGAQIGVAPQRGKALIFDAKSELRISGAAASQRQAPAA